MEGASPDSSPVFVIILWVLTFQHHKKREFYTHSNRKSFPLQPIQKKSTDSALGIAPLIFKVLL